MTIKSIIKNFGLSDKEAEVYLRVLELGPSSVRTLALQTKINRGTTYDILKSLIQMGLVNYFFKDKNKHFIAEDPSKFKDLLIAQKEKVFETERKLDEIIPELKSIYDNATNKPKVKFYEGVRGIKLVLEDLLSTSSRSSEKSYLVYSSANIRKYLYQSFPEFTRERIRRGISVRVLALGSGGRLLGLDERKWITKTASSPTYTLIYAGKTALVSVDSNGNPISIIIEDKGIAQTQKILFESLWNNLR
jgi:sugar-specific transcriptional regulator TrmB